MPAGRRHTLLGLAGLAAGGLAGCADDGPARTYPPLRYDYLTPLRLSVGTVEVAELPPPGPLDAESPLPPGPALRQLVEERLSAGGSGGRALVKVEEARISRSGGGLEGSFAVRVDVMTTGGTRSGFAEARVSRTATGVGRNLRGALYDITKQMLDDMNVELEFQVRQSLRDVLQTTAEGASTPAAVQRQDLNAPRRP